jgi:hypothetical protein
MAIRGKVTIKNDFLRAITPSEVGLTMQQLDAVAQAVAEAIYRSNRAVEDELEALAKKMK